jgi:ribosomal protein S3
MSSSSSSSRHHHHHYHHYNRQEYDERELSSSHINGSNENLVHIKFLLPGTTTGSVIGKGGERIASLQKETNTKMKMSKAGVKF